MNRREFCHVVTALAAVPIVDAPAVGLDKVGETVCCSCTKQLPLVFKYLEQGRHDVACVLLEHMRVDCVDPVADMGLIVRGMKKRYFS